MFTLQRKGYKNCKVEEKYAKEEMVQHRVEKTFKERKERGEFTGKYGRKNNKKDNVQRTLELFVCDKS